MKFKSFLNQLHKKDKLSEDLKKQINDDFSNEDSINFKAFKKIKEMDLFDYDFYQKKYNYDLDLDPLLHYIYVGWKENKNPNDKFSSKYYSSFNFVKESGLNPLVYLVMYGFDEGHLKINRWVRQPKTINKLLLNPEIEKYDYYGLNNETRNPRVIVSLTSYPKRIVDIQYTLFSIFNQSFKPDKIVLWLAEEEFSNKEIDIPKEVLSFKKLGLEIKWCENIKSYKKLIPSLKEYPNDIIVTADDDIFYPMNWLERLYNNYLQYPNCIIGQRARKIRLKINGEIAPYKRWRLIKNGKHPSFLNFLTGAGGILYPPNSLNKQILDQELFKSLCPTGDDIWFWAMAVINKTKFKIIDNNLANLTYVSPAKAMDLFGTSESLWSINAQGKNDVFMNNVIEKFPQIKEIIKK